MIITRTPLRVSFCGGGTDLPAYYLHQQGAVVSTSLNKYVYITVNRLSRYFRHRILLKYSQSETRRFGRRDLPSYHPRSHENDRGGGQGRNYFHG